MRVRYYIKLAGKKRFGYANWPQFSHCMGALADFRPLLHNDRYNAKLSQLFGHPTNALAET